MGLVSFKRRSGIAALALSLACGIAPALAAQAPAAPTTKTLTPAQKHVRKPKAAQPAPEPVVETPQAPPAPKWPANEKAEHANVVWDGRALKIAAENSTLQQILHDVSTATGLKVEGLNGSSPGQRIYGNYGPAAARDVLGQLLEGSGYNVLMIGDQGEGSPRVLVLSAKVRNATSKPAQGQGQNDDGQDTQLEEDVPEEPEQPEAPPQNPNIQRPFGMPPQGPGGRSSQEILQELQQRQLIQQQQQQQGQPQQEVPPPQDGSVPPN